VTAAGNNSKHEFGVVVIMLHWTSQLPEYDHSHPQKRHGQAPKVYSTHITALAHTHPSTPTHTNEHGRAQQCEVLHSFSSPTTNCATPFVVWPCDHSRLAMPGTVLLLLGLAD
jgi:hypothetical protein